MSRRYRQYFLVRELENFQLFSSNIEEQSLEFVTYSLQPWLARIESAISRSLLTPEEKKIYYARFNVDGLLRGNYESRMQGYATGISNGFLCVNDVRRLENMDLVPDEEGGNLFLVNGSMTPLKSAGAAYQTSGGGSSPPEQDEPDEAPEKKQEDPDQEPEEDTKNNKPLRRGRRNT